MRVFLVGDSHAEVYFRRLKDKLKERGYDVEGRAIRGKTARWHLDHGLESFLNAHRPEIVLFSLGGNNMATGEALEGEYDGAVEEALTAAREAGATQIIWVGPAAVDTSRAGYKARLNTFERHEWTAQFLSNKLSAYDDVTFLDSRSWGVGSHKRDGVHFPFSIYYGEWVEEILPSFPERPYDLMGLSGSLVGLSRRGLWNSLAGTAAIGVVFLTFGLWQRKKRALEERQETP